MAMLNIMNTQKWSPWFPSLKTVVGEKKPVDLRCSFSKDFIENKLDATKYT